MPRLFHDRKRDRPADSRPAKGCFPIENYCRIALVVNLVILSTPGIDAWVLCPRRRHDCRRTDDDLFRFRQHGIFDASDDRVPEWTTLRKSCSGSLRLSSSMDNFHDDDSLTWFGVRDSWSREDAQALLDSKDFLPSTAYGTRKTLGRDAAEHEYSGKSTSGGVMKVDDPRLAMTYAEFPLESFDLLMDAALKYLPKQHQHHHPKDPVFMVDIGSGLGRIVLYSAMTRGKLAEENHWKVCGIEIASMLHEKALELVETAGMERQIFESSMQRDGNAVSFQLGSAIDNDKILQGADLVFSYSTAFKAKEFDPEVGALLLDTEDWSKPLSQACKPGCVAITTDRALDPRFGWKIVERLDVPNPEVLGTTGFVHVLGDPQ